MRDTFFDVLQNSLFNVVRHASVQGVACQNFIRRSLEKARSFPRFHRLGVKDESIAE